MTARYCSECGAEAREGARFCAACGNEVPEATVGSTGTIIASTPAFAAAAPSPAVPVVPAANPPAVDTASAPPVPAVAVPVVASGAASEQDPYVAFPWWQFIIFPIISVGLWALYWFYCTRKQVNVLIANGRTDAGTQTFGAVVPIWQCWVARDMWRDINAVTTQANTKGIDSSTYTILFVVFGYIPIASYFSFIILILFCITQGRFAAAMDALSGGRAPRRKLTIWNAVWAFLPIAVSVFAVSVAALAG